MIWRRVRTDKQAGRQNHSTSYPFKGTIKMKQLVTLMQTGHCKLIY